MTEPELIQMPNVSTLSVPQLPQPFPFRRYMCIGPDPHFGLLPIYDSTGSPTGALEFELATYAENDPRSLLDPGCFGLTADGKPILGWPGIYMLRLNSFMDKSLSTSLSSIVHMIRVYFTIGDYVDSYEWKQRQYLHPSATTIDDLSQIQSTNRLIFCWAPANATVSINFVPFSEPPAGPWFLDGAETYLDVTFMGASYDR